MPTSVGYLSTLKLADSEVLMRGASIDRPPGGTLALLARLVELEQRLARRRLICDSSINLRRTSRLYAPF